MKTFFNEFKAFIARGNVLDLAVGIIIGAAFTSIVNSLVNDILMPPLGLALNGVDFSNLYINLGDGEYESLAAAQEAGAPTINYGNFINEIIEFLIVAFVVFLLVRWFNRIRTGMEGEVPPGEPTTKACPYCYAAIPIKASRCPQCTSHLDDPQAAPPAASTVK